MVATGPRALRLLLCALLLPPPALPADPTQDIQRRISAIAMALSAGNPADALTPFDKNFADYNKLSEYFSGLTNAFQLASDLEFADQTLSGNEATLTVRWALTLTDQESSYSQNRNGEIKVRLILKSGKWKIIEFSPITLFDPGQHP